MSYISHDDERIVLACRTHKLCVLCDIGLMACMKFHKRYGMDPDSIRIKTCPVCERMYTDRPAISRCEGLGEICPECGTKEALEDYGYFKERRKEEMKTKKYLLEDGNGEVVARGVDPEEPQEKIAEFFKKDKDGALLVCWDTVVGEESEDGDAEC